MPEFDYDAALASPYPECMYCGDEREAMAFWIRASHGWVGITTFTHGQHGKWILQEPLFTVETEHPVIEAWEGLRGSHRLSEWRPILIELYSSYPDAFSMTIERFIQTGYTDRMAPDTD